MSFSDMMSSARGPGVIGMLLALVVVIGFGVLFMFAFDEGFQGGEVTIESEIASQTKELAGLQTDLAAREETLKLAPARSEAAGKLRLLKVDNTTLAEKAGRLKSEIEKENAAIKGLDEEWAAYKDRYRQFVRDKAVGEKLEQLEARDGTVYKEVDIREVTAIGMQIRHAGGLKRLEFEELSDEVQDYYQYDPAQKKAAVNAEHAARKEHEAAAGVAMDRQAEEMAKLKAKEDAEAKEEIKRDIVRKRAEIAEAEKDIVDLQAESSRADAAAAAARAAGRRHLSKSNNINGKIRSKKNRIAELKNEIARLQSQL